MAGLSGACCPDPEQERRHEGNKISKKAKPLKVKASFACLVVQFEVGVHLEARVERFDRVAIASVAVVQEPNAVPQARVLRGAKKEGGQRTNIIRRRSWL